MRPHVLEVEAFMAFPGAVRLNFDELAQTGLLLLCGATGAGKTSLLDALGFALYGVVPGERAKAREDLRSHHADPAARAQVRLEFTARGRRLRITRRPGQERPRSRGTGWVREQPTALLEQRTGDRWTPVAQRNEDVGLEVRELLGMDAAQFFQVVVLPQGRFADFLQARHDKREELLKQLFSVDRFERAERVLSDRAVAAERRLEQARAQLHVVASRVGQAGGVEPPEQLPEALGWAAELAADAGRARDALAEQVRSRAARREQAERARHATEQLAARQDARRAALAELARLEDGRPACDALAAELDLARRVAPVVGAARTAAVRRDEADRAATGEAQARSRLAALGGPSSAGVAELRRAGSGLRTESGRLAELRDVQEQAELAEGDAQRAADRRVEIADRLALAVRRAEVELPAEREGAQRRAAAARDAERALPAARAEHERRQGRARLAAELDRLQQERTGLVVTAERTAADAAAAREAAADLREQRLDAIRFELAASLVDGDPCPVCGALEHPEIAEVRADPVSREAERAAQEAAERLAGRAAQADRALLLHDARTGQVAEQLAAAGEMGPVEEAARRLAALKTAAADLPAAEARLAGLQSEAEQLGTALGRDRAEAEQVERDQQRSREQAARLRARVRSALGDGVDLLQRTADVGALADAAEAAAEAAATAHAAQRAADDATTTAVQLAAAAGCGDVVAALAAGRDEAWQLAAQRRLQEAAEALAGVRARLAGQELDVELDPPAPVEAARTSARAAAEEHEQALTRERLVRERAEQLAALVPAYEQACSAVPQLQVDAAERRGLAELVAGRAGNRLSMPLSTFVLAARLEEVAQAASLRLGRMSGGRYALVHSDAGRDRRSRAGLGLQVEDAWTGRRRDTATLSGGEVFMTALSLALGLADVVTAEAGGRSIDALFVDEGFGSLDAGSLDQVMDVLDELRSGGRLVGVISHVAELRSRIPAQVQVRKGVRGSTLEAS